jgi:hypothetical protein
MFGLIGRGAVSVTDRHRPWKLPACGTSVAQCLVPSHTVQTMGGQLWVVVAQVRPATGRLVGQRC